MNFNFTTSEQRAKQLLEDFGLKDPTEYPLEEIILGRGAFYEEIPLKGKDGQIISYQSNSIIQVNSNIQYETRKRFAAAHELGHFELHRTLKPIFTDTEAELLSWYKSGGHEAEANEFASEFLMPSDIFFNECKGKFFGPNVIEHLSERFKVSNSCYACPMNRFEI
jgi:Zn-dependent peptidase ImmA (M78 family)